jgi:glycosyltransferase involved in cell wall biosynthesis
MADPLLPVQGGGQKRLFHILQHLRSQGYRTALVCRDHGHALNPALKTWADSVWVFNRDAVPAGASFGSRAWRALRQRMGDFQHRLSRYLWRRHRKLYHRLARRFPSFFCAHLIRRSFILRKINPAFNEYARQVAWALRPEAVVAEYVWTARCLDHLPPGVLKIVDTVDIQHLRRQRAVDAGSDMQDRACTREEEVGELSRADVLVAIQPEEAVMLREMCPDRRVIVVEHAEPRNQALTAAESQRVLFVGNLYDPNVHGLRQFLAGAWPRVRAACPEATLQVCGKVCAAFEQGVPEGIELAGFVDNLDACYAEAAVVVNPVPYGTGLKIKTVEALLHGKALVTTECGVEGLGETSDPPYLLAPIAAMADPIIELLCDPARRAALEQAAWAYACDRFSEERAYGELLGILNEYTAARR